MNLFITGFYSGGSSGDGLRIFKIVSFTLAIPPILCATAIVIFVCMVSRRRRAVGSNEVLPFSGSAVVSPQPSFEMTGLDESTIESYTKVVLGESRRVPGPSDGSCPICLSDYQTKETVRCIPECEHCFHAACIDEWLKMKGTCPLCRHSPSPARVIVETWYYVNMELFFIEMLCHLIAMSWGSSVIFAYPLHFYWFFFFFWIFHFGADENCCKAKQRYEDRLSWRLKFLN